MNGRTLLGVRSRYFARHRLPYPSSLETAKLMHAKSTHSDCACLKTLTLMIVIGHALSSPQGRPPPGKLF